jgi:hypothetical protein
MFVRVAGVHRNDVICNGRFAKYVKCKFALMPADGDVQKVDLFVNLIFDCEFETVGIARAEPDESCAETRFRLSEKRTSPFESAGVSFQSDGRRLCVHIVS